jgi:hypothetical protein
LKQIGVKASQRFAQAQLRQLPVGALGAINRAVGFQLISRFGRQGVLQLHQAIPLLGGLVGGGIDYLLTRRLGEMACAELGPRGRPGPAPRGDQGQDIIDVEWR